MLSEVGIKKTNSLTVASWRIKYLGINLTKEVKDLHSENYKTAKKETEEDPNKWKHILCPGTERITLLKCPYWPMQSTIPSKIPTAFSTKLEQTFLKFIWDPQRPQRATAVLREKKKAGAPRQPTSHHTTRWKASRTSHCSPWPFPSPYAEPRNRFNHSPCCRPQPSSVSLPGLCPFPPPPPLCSCFKI